MRRLFSILRTNSVTFGCFTNTPEMICMLGYVEMIVVRPKWVLRVVNIDPDVNQALLLCHKILFLKVCVSFKKPLHYLNPRRELKVGIEKSARDSQISWTSCKG